MRLKEEGENPCIAIEAGIVNLAARIKTRHRNVANYILNDFHLMCIRGFGSVKPREIQEI